MKSLEDAIEVRRRILLAFEEAEYELDEEARRGKLTFVIVGGGPTGVELAGAIRETATETLPSEFRHVDTATARIILIEGGNRLLGGMPEEMGMMAKRDLENMGIEVYLKARVTAVDTNGAWIGDTHVPAENVFWAAGVKGTSLAHSLGVDLDRIGRIKVNSDLSVPGHPRAFVAGDAANVMDPITRNPVSAIAQGAIQMGKFVAKVILQDIDGVSVEHRPSFHYKDKGSMAAIGRGKALASIGKVTLGGFIGWVMWGLIHVMFLVGFRTKIVVMVDWIRNYIGHERGSRLITGDPEMNLKVARGVILSSEAPNEKPDP
jgi:NADH dehydrogenase